MISNRDCHVHWPTWWYFAMVECWGLPTWSSKFLGMGKGLTTTTSTSSWLKTKRLQLVSVGVKISKFIGKLELRGFSSFPAMLSMAGIFGTLVFTNPISTKFGKKKMLLIDCIVMIVGTLVTAITRDFCILCLGRVIMGKVYHSSFFNQSFFIS